MSLSPNVPSPQESYQYESSGTPRWIAVLFGLLIVGLGLLAYAGHSVQSRMEQELLKNEEQNKILTAQLEQANTRIADLKGAGCDAFTIGSAAFDGSFSPRKGRLLSQLKDILAAC